MTRRLTGRHRPRSFSAMRTRANLAENELREHEIAACSAHRRLDETRTLLERCEAQLLEERQKRKRAEFKTDMALDQREHFRTRARLWERARDAWKTKCDTWQSDCDTATTALVETDGMLSRARTMATLWKRLAKEMRAERDVESRWHDQADAIVRDMLPIVRAAEAWHRMASAQPVVDTSECGALVRAIDAAPSALLAMARDKPVTFDAAADELREQWQHDGEPVHAVRGEDPSPPAANPYVDAEQGLCSHQKAVAADAAELRAIIAREEGMSKLATARGETAQQPIDEPHSTAGDNASVVQSEWEQTDAEAAGEARLAGYRAAAQPESAELFRRVMADADEHWKPEPDEPARCEPCGHRSFRKCYHPTVASLRHAWGLIVAEDGPVPTWCPLAATQPEPAEPQRCGSCELRTCDENSEVVCPSVAEGAAHRPAADSTMAVDCPDYQRKPEPGEEG